MALPLLIGMGLGYMGGAKYLMNKADERQSESMLANFQPQIPGLMGQEWNANFAQQAQQVNAPRSFGESLFAPSRTAQAQSLLNNYQDMHAQTVQNQAAAQQQQMIDSVTYGDKLMAQQDKLIGDLAPLEDTYLKGIRALESNNQADILASGFNFGNLVEPGGVWRDSESGAYKGAGGFAAQMANALNMVAGEGLSDKSRNEIKTAMENQYMQRFNRAKKQREWIADEYDKYRSQGYDPTNPEGRLGVNWDYQERFQEQGMEVPAGYTLDPNQEP